MGQAQKGLQLSEARVPCGRKEGRHLGSISWWRISKNKEVGGNWVFYDRKTEKRRELARIFEQGRLFATGPHRA